MHKPSEVIEQWLMGTLDLENRSYVGSLTAEQGTMHNIRPMRAQPHTPPFCTIQRLPII